MTSGPFRFIADVDLHGLVDGQIDADRRAEALRHIAASAPDRARVESWQSQNDLLRSAFAGLEREPLPPSLDLMATPHPQIIPANDSVLAHSFKGRHGRTRRRLQIGLAVTATIALIAAGLGAMWMFGGTTGIEEALGTAPGRGSVDMILADRSTDAIGRPSPVVTSLLPGDRLPTTRIPDLQAAGFSFAGAEIEASEPVSILFRYQNSGGDRLVVSVARARPREDATMAPVLIGGAYSWRKRDEAFAIAGTLRAGRLRAVALALQNDDAK